MSTVLYFVWAHFDSQRTGLAQVKRFTKFETAGDRNASRCVSIKCRILLLLAVPGVSPPTFQLIVCVFFFRALWQCDIWRWWMGESLSRKIDSRVKVCPMGRSENNESLSVEWTFVSQTRSQMKTIEMFCLLSWKHFLYIYLRNGWWRSAKECSEPQYKTVLVDGGSINSIWFDGNCVSLVENPQAHRSSNRFISARLKWWVSSLWRIIASIDVSDVDGAA